MLKFLCWFSALFRFFFRIKRNSSSPWPPSWPPSPKKWPPGDHSFHAFADISCVLCVRPKGQKARQVGLPTCLCRVGVARFELATPWTPFKYATKLRYTPLSARTGVIIAIQILFVNIYFLNLKVLDCDGFDSRCLMGHSGIFPQGCMELAPQSNHSPSEFPSLSRFFDACSAFSVFPC